MPGDDGTDRAQTVVDTVQPGRSQQSTARERPGSAPRVIEPPLAELPIDHRIGDRYVVRAVLGKGGMGTVYRALDEQLGVDVALKVVRPGVSDDELRDEVRLAQKVTHPNVCRTYDLEDVDGMLFVKMELVPGESLAARLARGRLPIAEAVRIARAIADGLAAVHAAHIIHRDLKPANVMLGADGRVVLMDFGIAHRRVRDPTGASGTPGYMAPEQIRGDAVDERTDAYALGCVIYEMLSGKHVFGGSSQEISDRHLAVPAPDVRTIDQKIPRWLARATGALLSKSPAERAAGLRMLAPARRSPIVPLVAAIAIVVAAIVVVWTRRPAEPWRPQIVDIAPAVEESSDGASLSPDGQWLAFNSDREQADVFRLYVQPVTGGDARAVTPPGTSYDEPRWTRDGKALLSAAGWDRMAQIPIAGGAPFELGPGSTPDDCGDAVAYVAFSWDGARLMLRADDGTRRELLRAWADETLEKPRCDPSGQRILFARGLAPVSVHGSDLYVIDRAGRITTLTTDHSAGPATWSADGRSIIYAARKGGQVQLYEQPAGGGPARQRTFGEQVSTSPDASRDGTTLLFSHEVSLFSIFGTGPRKITSRRETLYNVRVVDPATLLAERAEGDGDTVVVVDTSDGAVRSLAPGYVPFPSQDGKRVYFRTVDAPNQLAVIALAGGNPTTIATLPGRIQVGIDAPGGPHVEIDRDHHLESWHVRPDGEVVPDHVDGWLVPAPSGPWSYVQTIGADGAFTLHVHGPGTSRELTTEAFINTWLDDHRLAYADLSAGEFKVVDVTTGEVVAHVRAEGHIRTTSVLAADGVHWFDSKNISRVTRHLVTRFDSRD